MTKQTYKTTSKEVEFWLEYVDKQVLEDILYQQIENNVEFQKIQKDIENLLSGLTEEQLDEIFENL